MKKRLLRFLTVFICLVSFTSICNAASFSVSVGTRSITKGGSTKLTIKGTDVTGRFNISSSNSGIVSVSEDRAWIENNSYTLTLNALNVGTSTITITPAGVSDSNGSPVSLGSKTITVSVSLPREKSTDSSLKSLSVDGYSISPAFSKDIFEYKVTVPEGTKKIKIDASANDRYASVSGTGEKDVTEGVNSFAVSVKAENGSEKNYTITVDVVDENPINVTVDGSSFTVVKLRSNFECKDEFEEKDIVIENITIPACYNENLDYTLVGLKDSEGNITSYVYDSNNTQKHYSMYSYAYSKDLKIIITETKELEGHEKVKIKINDTEYNAYKYNNSDRFYVVYGKNIETGEEDFYLYDSKNNTFSSYDQNYLDSLVDKIEQNKIYVIIIIAFAIALFLAIICIISLISSKKKLIKRLKDDSKNSIKEEEEDYNILKEVKEKRKK